MDRGRESRTGKSLHNSAIAMIVAVMLALVAYVSGYFLLGEFAEISPTNGSKQWGILRTFPYHWQAQVFTPAAQIEAAMRGREVFAGEDIQGNPFE